MPGLSDKRKGRNSRREDEKDAIALALSFFDRYQQTQDITPLIKEFFVTDFGKRLIFCRTTSECGGFGRVFWQPPEHPLPFTPAENDYVREYAAFINYFYLSYQAGANLAATARPKSSEPQADGDNTVSVELRALLEDNPRFLRYDLFAHVGEPLPKAASIAQYRQNQKNFEQLIAALRIVESRSRVGLPKGSRKELSSKNFLVVFADNDHSRFFNYPSNTQMLEVVWPGPERLPWIMDLIREGGKLKIVAVYPGMD